MRKVFSKDNCIRGLCVILVIVALVAAFQILRIWEKENTGLSISYSEDKIVTYEGKDYQANDNIETFLTLGLDKYKDSAVADSHEDGVQTDFLMLFVIDNEARQYTAIHINRDTMTRVNKLAVGATAVVDTYTKQIAVAYNYVNDDNDRIRCRNTKDSVEYLLDGIEVDHYLSLTFDGVPVFCDFIGGVEVTVLDDFTGIDDSLVKGQKVTLSGEQALCYVRARSGLEDSSNLARMARQRQFINAVYEKASATERQDDQLLVDLFDVMEEYIVYDATDQKMMKIAEQLEDYQFLGIREIEGETKIVDGFIEFYPDEDAIKKLVMELFYSPVINE